MKNLTRASALAASTLLLPGLASAQQLPAGQPDQTQTQTQNPAEASATAPNVISSHQIDRYDAIQQVRQALQQDPKNLADWILLGELAQEVATEVPADTAKGYYRLARESYENALKLSPRTGRSRPPPPSPPSRSATPTTSTPTGGG